MRQNQQSLTGLFHYECVAADGLTDILICSCDERPAQNGLALILDLAVKYPDNDCLHVSVAVWELCWPSVLPQETSAQQKKLCLKFPQTLCICNCFSAICTSRLFSREFVAIVNVGSGPWMHLHFTRAASKLCLTIFIEMQDRWHNKITYDNSTQSTQILTRV